MVKCAVMVGYNFYCKSEDSLEHWNTLFIVNSKERALFQKRFSCKVFCLVVEVDLKFI